jgi:hypothetical protein
MKYFSSHESLKNKPFKLLSFDGDAFHQKWERMAMEAAEADGGQFGEACQALLDKAEDAWEENQYEHPEDIVMYYWQNNY